MGLTTKREQQRGREKQDFLSEPATDSRDRAAQHWWEIKGPPDWTPKPGLQAPLATEAQQTLTQMGGVVTNVCDGGKPTQCMIKTTTIEPGGDVMHLKQGKKQGESRRF